MPGLSWCRRKQLWLVSLRLNCSNPFWMARSLCNLWTFGLVPLTRDLKWVDRPGDPWSEVSDQNIRSVERLWRWHPSFSLFMSFHQQRSSSISSSQKMRTSWSWKFHCWRRASCRDLQRCLPPGINWVREARWPNTCCHNRVSWGCCPGTL